MEFCAGIDLGKLTRIRDLGVSNAADLRRTPEMRARWTTCFGAGGGVNSTFSRLFFMSDSPIDMQDGISD
jgi:hypothetical protein